MGISEENVAMEDSGTDKPRINKSVAINPAENVLGCMMVSVVIILTIFSSSLIQVFNVVPSNFVLVKSTFQLFLFTISNRTNSIRFIPVRKTEAIAAVVQGLLSGLAVLCSVASIRVLPLGHFFTIIFAKIVFVMILISTISGRQICKKKSALIICCLVGLIILVKTLTSSTQESATWTGLGLVFLYLLFSTLGDSIVMQTPQVAPGVLSFWSAVGGLLVCIPSFTSFYSEEPSILSGSCPSYMQGFLLVFLSLSTIASAIFTDQAEKLTSKTFVKVFRSWEIPLGLLVSLSLPSQNIPNCIQVFGILLIVGSSVMTQKIFEGEQAKHSINEAYEAV